MDTAEHDVIQSLWLGEVTTMERLSVSSFLENGHNYHLYAYGPLTGLPRGAELRDANEIIPSSSVFRDSRGGFSSFSNYFRYKLLLDRGSWWADTDVVCLQPFASPSQHLFSVEPDLTIATAVIRAPAGSDIMTRAWKECLKIGTVNVPWGVSGPELLGRLVEEMDYRKVATEPSVFFPIDWPNWKEIMRPGGRVDFGPDTKAVHLWNSIWKIEGVDKDARYPSDSVYEQLKMRYLGRKGPAASPSRFD